MKSLLTLPKEYIRPEWRTCAVPGRPWWQAVGSRVFCYMLRNDGAERRATEQCVEYDGVYPAPHPGFRPGQAWLIYFDGRPEPVALLLDAASARILSEDEQPDYTWAHLEKKTAHAVLLTGVDAPLTIAPPDSLGLPGRVFASYLIHDPFRPDLAPWSSR